MQHSIKLCLIITVWFLKIEGIQSASGVIPMVGGFNYVANMTSNYFYHHTTIPRNFSNRLRKIESIILLHPRIENGEIPDATNDSKKITSVVDHFAAAEEEKEERRSSLEPQYDDNCQLLNTDIFENFNVDLLCAAELECRLKHFEAELEQRPRGYTQRNRDSKPELASLFHSESTKNIPRHKEDKPLKVETRIFVESISDISEVNMDFTTTIQLYFTWTNELLKLPSARKDHSILLPEEILSRKQIWLPDIILVGTKRSSIQQTVDVNKSVRLYTHSGVLVYTVKLTATFGLKFL